MRVTEKSYRQRNELFYNIALTPWAHLTLDAQVVDAPLPGAHTAVVLGVRMGIVF